MPVSSSFLSLLLLLLFFFAGLHCRTTQKDASFSFDCFDENQSFNESQEEKTLGLYGDAEIRGSAVRLSSGRIMNWKPIRFFGARPGFSTYFAFSLSPGKNGISFFLVPSTSNTAHLGSAAAKGQEVGLFPNVVIAVEFIARMQKNPSNQSGDLIQIRVGDEVLFKSKELSDPVSHLVLNTGEKLHSWIDYSGDFKRIQVRLSKSKELRPSNASILHPIDLSNVLWNEAMLVGLSSSSENSTQTCSIYSWSFHVKHGNPYLMHSEPLDPNSYLVRANENPPVHPKRSYPWGIIMAMLFAAACGALVTFFAMLGWFALIARRPFAPVDCPVHPVDVVDEKIILVVNKGRADDAKK